MYTRVKKVGPYSYLQLVEGYREGSKVKQRVVATIGRLDQLKESGALQSLARTTARHCDELLLLDAHLRGEAIKVAAFRIGAGGRRAATRSCATCRLTGILASPLRERSF